jgi:1,4-alpha-glucan branching enzyme
MNKLRRIIFALFITLSLILGLSACRNKVKVEFDQASYTIKEGFEQKVPMHLTGVKFDNKDLVVESSNPNVFTVVLIDGFAEVTAVAPGTATLKILYKQKELASVEIKVIAREDLRVESLSIDLDTELNIEVGISEDVPIILTNIVYNDPDLTIISSNQLVATAVIKEGFITVTGVAVGTATLTLKKGEAVDTLVVNVSEGEVVIPDDETLVTFIVEVPMDTIGEVYVVTNLNDFDVEDGILLTKNADGKYEGSKSMKIGHELKYKYVNGKSWDYVEKLADGSEMEDNRTVTITDGMAPITDTVALWAGDIPPVQNVNVTFSVEVPADTKHVYIVGSFNNWNEIDPIEMAKDIETGKFTVVIELEVGQEVKYKYLNGKDWEHVEKGADGEEIGNRLLTPDAETTTVNDVVATWNLPDIVLGDPVTFKIIVTVPETTGDNEVHLISNLDEWSATKAHLLTKNEVTGKYEIELTHPENTVFKFKFVLNASWDRVEVDANGNDITDRQLTVVADMQPTECEVLRWKEIVDPTTKVTVRIEVAVPAETPADADVYLISDLDEWKEANAHKLTPLENGNFEIELSLVENSVFKFKFVLNGLWANVEQDANGEDIDDRSFTVTADLVLEPFAVARWKGIEVPAADVSVKFEVSVPAETPADASVYLIGSMINWVFADAYLLNKNGETGKYEVTLTLKDGTTYEYKYVIGKTDYSNVELQANGKDVQNRTLAVTEATTLVENTVARWKGIDPITEPTKVTVKIEVAVPAETPADANIYLISDLDEWQEANAHKLTPLENGNFEIELSLVENSVFKFKFVLNGLWANVEQDANGKDIDNRLFTVTADLVLEPFAVARWKGIEPPAVDVSVKFSVSVPAETPADANVYLVGSMVDWVLTDAHLLTKNGETGKYEVTLTLKDGTTYEYKYVIGNTDYSNVELQANGEDVQNRSLAVIEATTLVENTVARWKGIEPPAADVSVKFEVSVPAETPVDASVYLVGSMVEWMLADAHLLTKNGETGKYEITLTLKDGTTYTYKYVIGNTSYDNEEVDINGLGIDNRELAVTETTTLVENTVARWKGIEVPVEEQEVTFLLTVPVETIAPVCLVHDYDGNFDLTKAWTLNSKGENLFELKVTLPVGTVLKYKYTLNFAWTNVEMQADGITDVANREITVTKGITAVENTVARWKGIEPPAVDVSVKFSVSVPAETPTEANVYLVGSMVDWVLADAHLLTKNGETGKYEVTLTLKDGTTYEYKFVIGNTDYSNVELQANGEDVQNRTLVVTEATTLIENTVARWKGIEPPAADVSVKFSVEVPFETPADANVYLVGSMVEWVLADAHLLTKNGETGKYEVTLTLKDGTTYEYKYVIGNANYDNEEVQANGAAITNRSLAVTTEITLSNDVVARWKGVEAPNVQVKFIATLPAETPADATIYLVGSMVNWQLGDAYALTKNGETGNYEVTLTLKGYETYEYKYIIGNSSYDFEEYTAEGTPIVNRKVTVAYGMPAVANTVARWKGIEPGAADVQVKFIATVPAETPADASVYLVGSMCDWKLEKAHLLAKNGETGKYEVTITLKAGTTCEYKYIVGNTSYDHEEVQASGEGIANREVMAIAEMLPVENTVARWKGIAVPPVNMVQNPNFASGMDNWATFTGAGAANYTPDGENGLKVEVITVGASYEPRLSQMGIAFEKGKSYRISFDAKALAEKTINLQVGQLIDFDPYFINFINGWIVHREVGLEWNTLTFEFTMNHENPNGGIVLEFGTVGESAVTTTLWIRNVEVVEIDLLPVVKETVKFEVTVPDYTTGEVALVHNLIGWDALNGLVLTKNSETGKYEGQMDIQVGMTLEYKYVLNKSWDNVEVQSDGVTDIPNRVLNITSGMVKTLDTVQRWKGIEPPAPKVTTHFVLTVPTGTPADAVIYIIGELPGLENVYPEPPTQPTHAWGNFTDDYKLVKGEDGKYRISIESEPNFYLRYNYYIVMGDKNIREIGALRTHTAVATNTLNDEVTKWEEPVTITFSVTVPEGTPADASVYVIGVFKELIYPGMGVNPTQLNHQWNNFTNKYKMIKGEGSVYTLSLVIDYNYTFFYKYVYTVDNIDRFWETGDDRSRTATETITLNDTVSAWNPAPAKYTVTFSVTVPAVPEGANVYMIGVFPGLLWLGDLGEGEDPTVNHQWNNFSNTYKMTKGEGNVYTLNVEAPVNFTLIYKYAILTSSNDRVWEVHDNREYVVTAAGTQNDVVNSWEEIPTTDKMVLISVAAPAGTENVYFVGNVTEPTWDVSNPVPLTYNSVSGKFEIEAPFSVGYVLEYKFVCGPHCHLLKLMDQAKILAIDKRQFKKKQLQSK